MVLDRSRESVAGARSAVFAVFFLNGAVFANWVTRIPAVSDRTGATPGSRGRALLCVAIGWITARSLAGRAVDRYGSARVTLATGLGTAAAVPPPGVAGDAGGLGAAPALR